jgi:hypothetical protein
MSIIFVHAAHPQTVISYFLSLIDGDGHAPIVYIYISLSPSRGPFFLSFLFSFSPSTSHDLRPFFFPFHLFSFFAFNTAHVVALIPRVCIVFSIPSDILSLFQS